MKSRIFRNALIFAFSLSAATAQAAAPTLSELRIMSENSNIIDFKPEVTEYEIQTPAVRDVAISAAPGSRTADVTILSNGRTLSNHSVTTLPARGSITVSVADGNEKTDYVITLTSPSRLENDHRQLSIYQIFPAAFMRSETGVPGFTEVWGPAGHRSDGNLKGITESLDYIRNLGFNAIWLTPVFDCRNGKGGEKLQATGYFATDFFNIDPRFGTKEEFRELVNEAHKRDIYVILDVAAGHHGDNPKPSPKGNTIDWKENTPNVRGSNESGNIAYPGSLEFFKEFFRYWMEEFEVDGWRLDQCYQVYQNGHNYWKDLREVVESVAAERKAAGKQWGTLAYMVGEDWAYPGGITTTRQEGLRSVFDFEGREILITLSDPDLDLERLLTNPAARGYEQGVAPNLFVSNHDMTRVANIHSDIRRLFYTFTAMSCYSGPVTFFYNDEFAVKDGDGNPDNKARVSGRLTANNADEQWLHDHVAKIFNIRAEHPAMWRGEYSFSSNGNTVEITKTDPQTGETIVLVMPAGSGEWTFSGTVTDLISGKTYSGRQTLDAWTPVIYLR